MKVELGPVAGVLLVLAGAVLAWLGWWLPRQIRRLRMRARFRRARQGERDGEAFLRALGYRIVGSQVSRLVRMSVDGAAEDVEVRVDFVAERKGRRCVVEVKTGSEAVNPAGTHTRRQLLEYAVAFPDHDIILADMEQRALRRIGFPLAAPGAVPWSRVLAALAAVFAMGAASGAAALHWMAALRYP